ncbi:MAG: leucine-rich repeat protein [Clostridia bacterium]|nr:leucine-rich repeat protein [Clostridia bacterium]
MKKTNKLISILIAVAMLLSMAPISAFAASVVASGKFGASGSNLTWSLDSDGVLTISGSGAMEDFANVSKVPWYSKRTNVKTVVIESGVTNIGKDAFYGISSLVNATISDTVTSIGNRAFSGSGLTNFEFSDAGNLKTIGNSAFNSTQIKNMVIPDGVTTLGSYIFGYGPIKSVTIPASVTSVGNFFFEETSSLNEVIFLGNKEPETIGDTVFLGCSSLAYVSVPADYEGDTFSNMKVSKAVSSVAEVNGQGFATLADAISAAQSISGAELKLLSHISIDSGITIESGNFTIDLNGKELFSNGYFLLRIDGADVTIVDSAGGGIFNATNDQGNIVLEVLSGSANISGGTFNSAGYPATVRDGTLKLTGKDFVLNGNWRIGWYGGSIDLSACTADEVRIQACVDEGLQASAVALPDGWGLFETDGTPCIDFVKNDIYVAKAGFKVTASVNPAEGGTVEGAGTYSAGATVTLTATAANGYRFVNWTQNGEEVSTSAVYTFTASKNRELTANFEIVPHTHSFTYTAGGSRIVATCVAGDCPLENGIGGMLTISAPADLYVDGETAKEAVIDNQLVEAVDYTVTYSTADGSVPKTAGTYTASVTVGGATATVEFTLLNYAAKVTDKDGNAVGNYKTFAEAVTAASASEGSTVTLLDDVTLTEEQDISSGKFILDLNGKTLLNETAAAICIESDADVTIKDSGEGGTIESKADTWNTVYNYGTLTVESGIIKGEGGISNSRSGTLNFKSGKIEADTYYAIGNYGTAYIYNGSFKSVSSGAIENRSDSTVYVYGGEFSGSAGIVNHSTAYIEGGEFTGNSYAALNLHGGTVEVTGGSFTGTDFASGFYSGTPYGEYTVYCNEGAALILKGGEFPNGFVADETTVNAFLAEGYAFYDKDGYKITVADDATKIDGYVQVKEHFVASVTDKDGNAVGTYKTLADAITAAQGSEGSTLTLIDDCNVNYYVGITSGTFTFDLAGNSLTISGSNTAFFVDGSDVNLTIADSIGGGKIYASSMSLNIIAAQCVTINNGIFDGYLSLRNGSLIINGGTFNNGSEGGYSISDDDGTTVVIYGGEFPNGFYLPRTDFLNDFIAEGCYFRDADGKIITVADNISVIKGYVKIEKGAYITDGVITFDATEFTYTGSEIKPTVIVTIGGKAITEGKDYTLTFANNVNAGTATVTVTGAGDYKGEATKEFTIVKADNSVTAAPTPNTLTYKGEAHNLISAGEASFGTMVYSLDGAEYSETIPQGTDAGDYTVYYKVIGDSNHNDTEPATVIVTINAKDISDGSIILGEALTYNGKEQTQTVEKVLTTNNLEATYTVSGNKATNVGVYLLTVTGTGNFTGEAKIAYEIALDDECISHLDRVEDNGVMKWNVKSTDRESLKYVIDQLNNAVTDIADDDTKNEWADTKEACEDMLRIINSIELAIADVEEDYAGFSEDTVKSSDIPALDEIVSKVNEIKDRYGFNLTDEEAKKLEDILDGIEKLKAKIAETAEEIERIDEAVNGYDEETVTSDDIPELVKLIEDIKVLTDGDNLTEDERAALEANDEAIDEIVEKLAEVAEEIKKVDEAVKSYDEETVKSTDKEDLAQLKEDIQALIDSTNTTENEKTPLEEMIKDIEGLEDKITETEEKLEEIKDIENNFNPETVSSDDKAAIEDKIAEIEAVNPDNLTDEQREEYEEIKAGFEALLAEIAAAEKNVADIGAELEMFDEKRVTKFWEDDIEALKAKIDELLADENMGEAEKAKLDEYKAQAGKLIEIINTPKEYFSLRFFYLIWDAINWPVNRIVLFFNRIF